MLYTIRKLLKRNKRNINLLKLVPFAFVRFLIVKKMIIATASLIIPSPNTTLNSFGYFSGLIIVSAATESVAETVAEKIIT